MTVAPLTPAARTVATTALWVVGWSGLIAGGVAAAGWAVLPYALMASLLVGGAVFCVAAGELASHDSITAGDSPVLSSPPLSTDHTNGGQA